VNQIILAKMTVHLDKGQEEGIREVSWEGGGDM
jgi:hypothetical protein